MQKKTSELESILNKTKISDFEKYIEENKNSNIEPNNSFSVYFKELLQKKGITQLKAFLRADIPEKYGYKLLSGEKHTRQRDIILRLCYASEFSLEETQRILKMYELPALYPKIPRDAFLMILFNENKRNIIEINELLKNHGFDPLRTSGYME
ncbi:MAG: hypothetical protein IIY49_11630 [Eubacterium sp.]|nr:hypothetical protein [Eubacterium sp.]